MTKPVSLDGAGGLVAGGDLDMDAQQIVNLADGAAPDSAATVDQVETVPWIAETYAGDLNNAPLGWISCVPTVTNNPGVPGSGGYLVQTFRNEDNSARAQVAYSLSGGEIAVRFNVGGWTAWAIHNPG
ncbi:hypothetical protein IU501_34700 [Nocardia otitidiscaviarum]|uniref:hypothetical protein n=1 Tax=Nocardia otitidiscaviarum TaxID=1823 RepID=UPI001895A79E|nr:hypothetical protein [Nocardia otitidiscaviarum]MBF6138121.1 hypothetical protein [Nocardia otitidiscaviarum]